MIGRAVLDDAAFGTVRRLLRDAAGLAFDDNRRDSLALSVSARALATGAPSTTAYVSRLAGGGGGRELDALIDEVTVKETCFLRNPPQMTALRERVLPELAGSAAAAGRPLQVWSAGCATGEEAYTVAILLAELLGGAAPAWQVLGTDVAESGLDVARAGRYGERVLALVDQERRFRWFVRQPRQPGSVGGRFHVRPDLGSVVRFARHNLATDPAPFGDGRCDLVLCRNVTIYFDHAVTEAVIDRFRRCLRPGGYLLLGHSESLWRRSDGFELVRYGDAFVYRRAEPPAGAGDPGLHPAGRSRPVKPRRPSVRGSAPRSCQGTAGEGSAPGGSGSGHSAAGERTVPATGHAADADVAAARAAINRGDYGRAASLAEALIAAGPLRADGHYLLGLAMTEMGRDRQALVALRKAVYLEPDCGLAQFLLGGALERSGAAAAAAGAHRAAAQLLTDRPPPAGLPELGGRAADELAAAAAVLARRLGTAAPPRIAAGGGG